MGYDFDPLAHVRARTHDEIVADNVRRESELKEVLTQRVQARLQATGISERAATTFATIAVDEVQQAMRTGL